jgi:hypothetical protein
VLAVVSSGFGLSKLGEERVIGVGWAGLMVSIGVVAICVSSDPNGLVDV